MADAKCSFLRNQLLNSDQSERSGILAGGNWIIDRPKIIDVYPAQDSLANILRETSSNKRLYWCPLGNTPLDVTLLDS